MPLTSSSRRRGIQAVGVDAIIDASGVARQTLYRHFSSKQELVLAFLELREQRWTQNWLRADVEARTSDPRERLLAIFDVFDGWFQEPGFEGCSFINVMLEHPAPGDAVGAASIDQLARIRSFLKGLATDAGVADPDDFARKWHILMKGSIVARAEGDTGAARRAQEMGALLLSTV